MNRKKAVQSLGIFFLAMCLLTVFSRSMDSFRVAQVTAQTVTKTVLDYSVSGNGKVESSRELAVFTVPEMKVSSLNVQEGEQVKKGELLFQVDLNTLKKKRSSLMTELEQAKLTKEDADSQAKTTQEKQEEEISHARENYDQAVESADQAVAMAQQDLDLAREKLNDFYNTSESSFSGEGQSAQESEQSLLDEIYEKEKALELAFTEREKSISAARQALESASLPIEKNSTAQIQQLNVEQKQLELDQINALWQKEGKVYAPADGTVSKWNVKTGGVTSEEAAALLAKKSKNYQIRASIDSSLEKYLDVGAKAELTGPDGKKLDTQATLMSVKSNEEDAALLDLVFSVPASQIEIGENVEFELIKESKVYDSCLPLTALYEENSKYFVYVIEDADSVLGTVKKVWKISVEVEEKNETTAALKSGVLSKDQQVVVDTDREIQEGSRVRLKEE